MRTPDRSPRARLVGAWPALALLVTISTASAGTELERTCRRGCYAQRGSCTKMASALHHGCSDLCKKASGATDCRVACPASVYHVDVGGCLDAQQACRRGCATTSACAEACEQTYATCTDVVADTCRSCNRSSRMDYHHCRNALRPRRCRATVLTSWTTCVQGCKGTLASAFATCVDAREACLAACASPGGAFLD